MDEEVYSFFKLKPRPCCIYCESLYEQNLIMRNYDKNNQRNFTNYFLNDEIYHGYMRMIRFG